MTATASPTAEAVRIPGRRTRAALVVSAAARVVLGVLAVLLLLSVLPAVAGWQSSVVMSGSMEPTLVPGDVTVVRPVDPVDVRPGRIVLVDDPDHPGRLRIHRVVGREEGLLRLRGDANPTADSTLVDVSAVHGVGTLRLPGLGLPALWVAQGRIWPLAGAALVLAALLGLALMHRTPGPGEADDDAAGPGSPLPRPRTALLRRGSVLGVVVLALVTPVAATGASARFSASTANPTSRFASAKYWTCAGAISGAGATYYHPLQENAGTAAANSGTAGTAGDATYSSTGVTYRTAGPECADSVRSAITLDGASGQVWGTQLVTNPQTFTVQIWFATTTTAGGKLIGFGDGASGAASSNYDRHIYMTNTGQLAFGVYDGAVSTATSPAAYNDGRWHLATATFSPTTGMYLYVDGALVAQKASVTYAWNYNGYWRVGYDSMGNWPDTPASAWFAGSLAHAAVFPAVLSASEVAGQYRAGPLSCATQTGTSGTAAPRYLPMQEPAGPTAANNGSAGSVANGTYSGTGLTFGVTGPACGPGASAAVRFDGASAQLWTTQALVNPQVFSEAIWFSTRTTQGGKLIGFGSGTGGASSGQYDRHVYMTTTGQLVFGTYNGVTNVATSPAAYNDGGWHLATATFSANTGMKLYVDGALVASNATATVAENYTGYWRIGYDNLTSWPSPPPSYWFAGVLAHASVYDRVLSAAEVSGLYAAGS